MAINEHARAFLAKIHAKIHQHGALLGENVLRKKVRDQLKKATTFCLSSAVNLLRDVLDTPRRVKLPQPFLLGVFVFAYLPRCSGVSAEFRPPFENRANK